MQSIFGRRRPSKSHREESGVHPPPGISSSFFTGSLASTKNRAGFGSQQSFRSHSAAAPPIRDGPDLSRALSNTSSDLVEPEGPLDLKYGYLTEPLRTLEMGVVAEVVSLCGKQIKERGLQMPLILSTRALDITKEGSTSLISTHIHDRDAWYGMLEFANPHDLGAMIKYALGRVINPQGKHGVLGYEIYESWRMAERQSKYNPNFIKTHLLSQLPSATANLLYNLLDLLAATATYTSVNGSSPKKLSSIFSSYIFGLPSDEPFERTYAAFTRFTNATEHLLLAFIRANTDQLGSVPPKLQQFVRDYPGNLSLPTAAIRPDAQLRDVKRVSRLCRFYTQDLIQSASTWEVTRSKSWNALYPFVPPSSGKGALPVYASSYKHLLNIQDEDGQADDEHQRFKTTTEKDWFSFASSGFSPEPKEKLQFDLNESARQRHRGSHRTTRDWANFSEQGFLGQDVLDYDLSFDDSLAKAVANLREDKLRLDKLVRKTEKRLPDFSYDTTPHEGRPILVDEYFFEAWADTLVSSGWLRDEIKDSNWVLILYRSRPPTGTSNSADPDGRTEEQWFLIEESVPSDYRHDVDMGRTKKSKRLSFLRPSLKKKPSANPLYSIDTPDLPPTLPSQPIDTSVFTPGPGGQTRYLNFDRPPSQDDKYLKGPMHLQVSESTGRPPNPLSPVNTAVGALPGTITSQPQTPMMPSRPSSAQGQYLTGKEKGLRRRSTSFDLSVGRGMNLIERIRSRRHHPRQGSLSSLSEAENISRPPTSQSMNEFGMNGSNGSWVGILRRTSRSSRPSMDSTSTGQYRQPRRFAPPPSVNVQGPSQVDRALPALPDDSGAPSVGGKSSVEAVEEIGPDSRPPSVSTVTTSGGEVWRGSRYDTLTPEPLHEEDEDALNQPGAQAERPRTPSPQPVEHQGRKSHDTSASREVQGLEGQVEDTVTPQHFPQTTQDNQEDDLPPPIPLKQSAPAPSSQGGSTTGPHSERVAKLVAMYSSRNGNGRPGSPGVQKKPVPTLSPGEQ